MSEKTLKRAAWFIAAWAFLMCGLFSAAWILDVPTGQMNSWRFFGLYAVMFTCLPLIAVCVINGTEQK